MERGVNPRGPHLEKMSANAKIPAGTLYDPAFEHDACGVGFVADTQGRAGAHILPLALSALGRMAHRGAVDADGKTGDGAGVTTQIPYAVFDPGSNRMSGYLARSSGRTARQRESGCAGAVTTTISSFRTAVTSRSLATTGNVKRPRSTS